MKLVKLSFIEGFQRKTITEIASLIYGSKFSNHFDKVLSFADKYLSVVIFKDDVIIGFYLLRESCILEFIASRNKDYEINIANDLTVYEKKKALEGMALGVIPAFHKIGAGRILINYSYSLEFDYIWGRPGNFLNNLNDWLKRRNLIATGKYDYLLATEVIKTK